MVTEARVITSDEFIKRLEEKEMEAKVKNEQIAKRKQEREERKKQKEVEQEQKKMKKGTKRKTSDGQQSFEAGRPGKKRAKKNIVVCKICRFADPKSGEGDIDWVQCELCDEWCHLECSDMTAEEIEEEEVCFKCLVCLELGEE
jgi:phenylalanyl-tRNA synthetase alpha subunit